MNPHDLEQLETHMDVIIELIVVYYEQLRHVHPPFSDELINQLVLKFSELCWTGEVGKGYRNET